MMLASCEQQNYYQVEITYQSGATDTLSYTGEKSKAPKVHDDGCVYDFANRSYICGVRKIKVLQQIPVK